MTVIGVDGWRGRWVAATIPDGQGRRVEWSVHDRFADLLGARRGDVVAVDMPIGWVDGLRESDRAAREWLRERGGPWQSIFLTPSRPVVEAFERDRTHAQAMAERAPSAPGTSIQAWNLIGGMLDVRDAMAAHPGAAVVEAHPECSFRALAPDLDLVGKKTGRGAGLRLRALAREFDVDLAGAPFDVPVDDLLDAVAVAWTARRVARGENLVLGPADGPHIVV